MNALFFIPMIVMGIGAVGYALWIKNIALVLLMLAGVLANVSGLMMARG